MTKAEEFEAAMTVKFLGRENTAELRKEIIEFVTDWSIKNVQALQTEKMEAIFAEIKEQLRLLEIEKETKLRDIQVIETKIDILTQKLTLSQRHHVFNGAYTNLAIAEMYLEEHKLSLVTLTTYLYGDDWAEKLQELFKLNPNVRYRDDFTITAKSSDSLLLLPVKYL